MCLLLIIHVPSLYVYLLKICSFHRLLKSPSKIFLTKHFMYFHVYVSAQMFVMHHVHAWCPQRIEEDMGSTGNSYRQPPAHHTHVVPIEVRRGRQTPSTGVAEG